MRICLLEFSQLVDFFHRRRNQLHYSFSTDTTKFHVHLIPFEDP